MPEPVVRPAPSYTIDGRKSNVQGSVVVQCVVHKEGNADNCRLIKGLGFGLDESATKTIITEWRFNPGLRDGVPVDAVANIEVPFRLNLIQ
jgi:TonB family protein